MIFLSLLSCYLIPTIDKPTRVYKNPATLIDNIFVNTPKQVTYSRNIISDVSDHFSQFCFISSAKGKTFKRKIKVRDFSNFSEDSFINDVSQVNRDSVIETGNNYVDRIFSSFYEKLNKLVNMHEP